VEIDDEAPARGLEQVSDVVVGAAGVRDVDEHQQKARRHLERERDREDTAEEIPDAVRLDWDQVLPDELSEAELSSPARSKRRARPSCEGSGTSLIAALPLQLEQLVLTAIAWLYECVSFDRGRACPEVPNGPFRPTMRRGPCPRLQTQRS
jgi:hypothetical protein